MRLRSVVTFGFLLLLPLPALAKQEVEWSFLNSALNGRWEVRNLNPPDAQENGLHIQTDKDGFIVRETADLPFGIDAVTVQLSANRPMDAALLWSKGSAEALLQKQFTLEGTGMTERVGISLSGEHDIQTIGLAFPAGAEVTVQSLTVHHWNPFEKAMEMLKSFWMFDRIMPYSINFLWGPIIASNPIARETLFDTQPPPGHSGIWLFYIVLGIAGLSAVLWKAVGNGKRRTKLGFSRATMMILGVAALCWFTFDVRMSAEYWSTVIFDVRGFVTQPPADRNYRNFENIYDIVTISTKHLAEREKFVYLSDYPQLGGMVRYFAFPNLPVTPEKAPEGTRSWLVFRKEGAEVSANGELKLGDKVLAGPGTVVEKFIDGSFLFQTQQ